FGTGAFEKILAQKQVRQDDPGGKKIRTFVGDLKISLFGAHVIRLAGDYFTFVIHEKAAGLGDAEIGQLHVTLEGDHDVFEADIPVNQPEGLAIAVGFGMGVSEAAGDPADNENGEFARQDFSFIVQLL